MVLKPAFLLSISISILIEFIKVQIIILDDKYVYETLVFIYCFLVKRPFYLDYC